MPTLITKSLVEFARERFVLDWDADRLDLGRVGIRPAPKRLCTDAARAPEVVLAAYVRSLR